ncbi:serine/threonine-protein phosphatase 7 long form-like protein [Cucumis melo var. makuwa]|uniref:Serine/threonine-protein phosphatase 7 long form-like protein n=1 Tax=Cucumis melo var. makuwa TaxID=1194695 RepID=A0A5D3BTK4_CUCMM|nr:serine/threonine-protein phosphatase 7 long form-like protein [Cucumis melo var. makuwa]
MGYLLHRRVELSEERGSVSGLTFDYCTSRALETRDPHISHAMWGVQDHPAGCCSAVGVASGWGASDRIIKFEELPPDADIVSIQRYARAYIMQLIGGFIFADKSNTLVYCMFSQFLFDFDQMSYGQVVWTGVGLLICFHLVEKHQPDRVLRQFNMLQMPQAISYTDQRLHQIDLRGKHDQDWCRIHAEHIGVWNSRYDFRVEAPTTSQPTVSENYFVWYKSITRRFITQKDTFYHCMYNFVDIVQTFSVEHDIKALGHICDRTTERVEHIIQQTRRLTVADTDRRRMRCRR